MVVVPYVANHLMTMPVYTTRHTTCVKQNLKNMCAKGFVGCAVGMYHLKIRQRIGMIQYMINVRLQGDERIDGQFLISSAF